MKLFTIIGLTALTLFFIECNPAKKNQKNTNSETNLQKVRLKVSFISIGQGINLEAAKYFPQLIEKFNKEHKVTLKFEVVPWGREGEFNYCFYEQKKINEFILQAQKEMSKYENVEFHENPLNCDR